MSNVNTIAAEVNDLQAARRADYAARAKKAAETRARKAAEAAAKIEEHAAEIQARTEEPKAEAPKKDKTPYFGPMLALRSASRNYVKGIHCGDIIANAFDGMKSEHVILTCIEILGLGHNPYVHLNVGQQSMNLRNRVRASYKKGQTPAELIYATASRLGFTA